MMMVGIFERYEFARTQGEYSMRLQRLGYQNQTETTSVPSKDLVVGPI